MSKDKEVAKVQSHGVAVDLPTGDSFIHGSEDLGIQQLSLVQGMTQGVDPTNIGQWYDRGSKAVYGRQVVGHILEHRTVKLRLNNTYGSKDADGNVPPYVESVVKKVLVLPQGASVPVVVNVKLPNYEWAATATSLVNFPNPAIPLVTFASKLVQYKLGQGYVATFSIAPCDDQAEAAAAAAAYQRYGRQWAESQPSFEDYSDAAATADAPSDKPATSAEEVPFA